MDDDSLHAINQVAAHVGQLEEAVRKLAEAVILLADSGSGSMEATNAKSLATEAQRIAGG